MTDSKVIIAHNIGQLDDPNYNTIEELRALPAGTLLTFDGIYRNVWENREVLRSHIKENDGRVILFVIGSFVGGNNGFSLRTPMEAFCDWNQLMDLAMLGCEIGWHTWSHRSFLQIKPDKIRLELRPPFPMRTFAYPYGRENWGIRKLVAEARFERAFVVHGGAEDDFSIPRQFIREELNPK